MVSRRPSDWEQAADRAEPLGLRVVTTTGRPIDFRAAALRNAQDWRGYVAAHPALSTRLPRPRERS